MPSHEKVGDAIAMLQGFNRDVWAPAVTMDGKAQINRPGWEITEMWPGMYQAIAIASKYRFCGQGISPKTALKDAHKVMEAFRDELNVHLVAK
tara:strand:- start:817 stop:1095 length:279 start_codon:yes stop_codon:yes gene_type:complete